MRFLKNIKKRYDAYLERMGEANSRNFGDNRLDCCTLNQNNEPVHQINPKEHPASHTPNMKSQS